MPGPADDSNDPSLLGDYRLGRLIAEGERSATYEADQISIRRTVLLEWAKLVEGDCVDQADAFLDDVRAKAALHHPVIGSVYEAVRGDEGIYYTRERLNGRPLDELLGAGELLEPRHVLQLLAKLGEAFVYLEERRVATSLLEPGHLVYEEPEVVRMENLAVAGDPKRVNRQQDRLLVSVLLRDLIAPGRPGATRTTKLLELLGGEQPPNWPSVAHTADKLAHDLAEQARTASTLLEDGPPRPRAPRGPALFLGLALLGLMLVAVGGAYLLGSRRTTTPRPLEGMVKISGAKIFTPDGEVTLLPPYWIDAHEVTIAEYAEFLRALAMVDLGQRHAYNHPAQPTTESDHAPDDWVALLAAASAGNRWNGLLVDPNCPVVNVDWWDAYAYANWRGGRLPTQAEWFAAAEGSAPNGAGWGPVDATMTDRTLSGIHGLAGNVSEWIQESIRNPAFPMNPKSPLSAGASYLHPQNGALSRLWHPTRETRQRDLGIRVVREFAP